MLILGYTNCGGAGRKTWGAGRRSLFLNVSSSCSQSNFFLHPMK